MKWSANDPTSWKPDGGSVSVGHPAIARAIVRILSWLSRALGKTRKYLAAAAIPLATLLDYVAWNVMYARKHGRITWRQSWTDNVSYWRVHF